jgi:peptide/nickel transport system permease protein
VILVVLVCAAASALIAPYDPIKTNTDITFASPSAQHLLGTDNLGRDILSRIVYGSRTAILVGAVSALVGAGLGVPLGLVAGYLGKLIDEAIMRTMDAFYAFPSLLLALAIIAALGSGIGNVMLAIGITFVPVYARIVRGSTLAVKHTDFVLAAQAMGASNARVMLRHILPNVWAPVIVQVSLGIGYAIVAEAGLSFLGLGTRPPTPSWGSMLQLAQRYLSTHGTLALYPGLAIVIVVLAFNLFGDALRDELDPRLRGGD